MKGHPSYLLVENQQKKALNLRNCDSYKCVVYSQQIKRFQISCQTLTSPSRSIH